MPGTTPRVTICGHDVAYRVRRSARARHAAVHLHPRRGIEVVLPANAPETDAAALLHEKRAWLERHAADVHRAGRAVPPRTGAQLPYRGHWRRLSISAAGRAAKSQVSLGPGPDALRATVPDPGDEAAVQRLLTTWYRARAREHLLASVARIHDPADGRVRRLSVRDQDSRWGSCSSTGGLNFNWRLVMAPPPVLDAVVAHELVHLTQLDHSREFWDRLDARFPRHLACRRWLDANAYRLTL